MASELMLLENPRRRHRSYRRSRYSSNPMPKGVKGFTQGVTINDLIAGVGSAAVVLQVPGLIIKPAAGTTVFAMTTVEKLEKLGISAALAIAAGMLGNSIKAGKSAIIGGVAGVVMQACDLYIEDKTKYPMIRRIQSSPIMARPQIQRSYVPDFEDIKAM